MAKFVMLLGLVFIGIGLFYLVRAVMMFLTYTPGSDDSTEERDMDFFQMEEDEDEF